jgi:hypothetical protein
MVWSESNHWLQQFSGWQINKFLWMFWFYYKE